MAQGVVAAGFDGIENGGPPRLNISRSTLRRVSTIFASGMPSAKERARATDQILHEVNVTIVEAALHDFSFGHAVRRGNIQRNVDAAFSRSRETSCQKLASCNAVQVASKDAGAARHDTRRVEDEASDGICG